MKMEQETIAPRSQHQTPNRTKHLPDLQGYGWKTHSLNCYDCGTTTVSPWQLPSADDYERVPGTFECVTGDAANYLNDHGVRELDIPQYYSRFQDEFGSLVTKWTIEKRGIAIGVDANLLERAVRLANGKGHIDHDALEVHLCDTGTLFVAGTRGVFLVDQISLKQWDIDQTPPDSAYIDIRGFPIPETDTDFQRGLRRFIDAFEKYADPALDSFKHISDGKHVFQTDSGRAVYANRAVLNRLTNMTLDETDLYGTYTYTLNGKTYKSIWDGTTTVHDRGDETRRGIVLGYDHQWEEQKHIMSDTVYQLHSKCRYICLSFRPDMYDRYDFEVVCDEHDIDTFHRPQK